MYNASELALFRGPSKVIVQFSSVYCSQKDMT